MTCTFDASCLTSLVNGAQPSFGFNGNDANYFGISAQFTSNNGVKCYTDNRHSFLPIFHSGSITQTCIWAGGVQSLYCPGLKNSAIPTGTHTITYSAPDGYTPFPVTSFVVAQAQATNTITVTNHYYKTAPAVTTKSTSTVTAPAGTTTSTSIITVGGKPSYVNDTRTVSTTQQGSYDATTTVTQDFTTTILVRQTQTETDVHNIPTDCSATNSSPSTVTVVSTTTSTQPDVTPVAPATILTSTSIVIATTTVSTCSSCTSSSTNSSSSPSSSNSSMSSSLTSSSSTSSSSIDVSSFSSTSSPFFLSSSSSSTSSAPPTTMTAIETQTTIVQPSTSSASFTMTLTETTTTTQPSAPVQPTSSSPGAAVTITQTTTVASPATTTTAMQMSSTASSAPDATSTPSCPGSDGQTYDGFVIECYSDRANLGSDFAMGYTNSLNTCIDLCQSTSGCIDVSWIQGTPGPCYLKNKIVRVESNGNVWGARDTAAATSASVATSAATSSAARTSTTSAAATSTSSFTTCPGNDGQQYTAPSGDIFQVECYDNRQNHDISSGSPVFVLASDLGACMNACDANDQCVDVTLSGVACYLKSGIGASQTGDTTAYGGRLISSKTKTIPSMPGNRKRSAKHGPVIAQPHKAHVTAAPRMHPRHMMGPKVLTGVDERACSGGCSGWGGPDTTWTGGSTQTLTTTEYIATTPTISQSTTTTVRNNETVTSYATVTTTGKPQTVTNHYTITAVATNGQAHTQTATVTSIHIRYVTSTATTTTSVTTYLSCPYTFTTMTVASHFTITTSMPHIPATKEIDSTTTTTSTTVVSSTTTIHIGTATPTVG